MKLNKKLRLLVTTECPRQCVGCCNTYTKIMENATQINTLEGLINYSEIMITGGEPMLHPDKTLKIIDQLKKRNPDALIYLYSALYNKDFPKLLEKIDGLHFTLHYNANDEDIFSFYKLQESIFERKKDWRHKSFRLYIDNKLGLSVKIIPFVWDLVNVSKWLTEEELIKKQPQGLPLNEELFILGRNYYLS